MTAVPLGCDWVTRILMSGSQSQGSSHGGQKMTGPKMSAAFTVADGVKALLAARRAGAAIFSRRGASERGAADAPVTIWRVRGTSKLAPRGRPGAGSSTPSSVSWDSHVHGSG